MDMMAYHRSDDITKDLMAATIDMMTGLPPLDEDRVAWLLDGNQS